MIRRPCDLLASRLFNIDNMTEEKMVAEIAESMGLPGFYGI